MQRTPYPTNIRKSDFNNNNLHHRDPYIIDNDGVLAICENWWHSLSQYTKDLIKQRICEPFRIQYVPVPHAVQSDRRLTDVYQSYQDGYDYQVWYDVNLFNNMGDVKMIKLSVAMKKHLALNNGNTYESMELIKQLDDMLDGKQYFDEYVKIGSDLATQINIPT